MHITYKGETYTSDIILGDFRKKSWIAFFLLILYGVLCFDLLLCDDFETQNNDLSYHDQRLIRPPCGEKNLKIYPMVVLEFEVKLRVSFLFVFSIYVCTDISLD